MAPYGGTSSSAIGGGRVIIGGTNDCLQRCR